MVAGFGIAFFLIFAASVLLLYLSEDVFRDFLIKAAGMLLVYLALYVFYSIFITKRIKKMFLPLDRLAYGLIRERVYVDSGDADLKNLAESLKAQAERMNRLSRELEDTRSNLDDAFMESRMSRDEEQNRLQKLLSETERLRNREEELSAIASAISDSLKESLRAAAQVEKGGGVLSSKTSDINEEAADSMGAMLDMKELFTELKGDIELLNRMTGDAGEGVEELYNSLTEAQSQIAQINLYAMNTSLDIARSGNSISAITALNEIKDLTGKLNEKSDEILIGVIRIRNAIKLLADQTGECLEREGECAEDHAVCLERLTGIREHSGAMKTLGTEIAEGASVSLLGLKKADSFRGELEREEEKLKNDIERLGGALREWRDDHGDKEE